MKKTFFFLIPLALFLIFSLVANKLFLSGSINPVTFVAISAGVMILMAFLRPKSGAPARTVETVQNQLGDFSRDAFSSDAQARNIFDSAVNDYAGNMPKAALNKLAKLESQCAADPDRYAVAMLTAMCMSSVSKYDDAIRQYNKAVVIHPTPALAVTIGSVHQRLGKLKQAIDSYEFALDLDPACLDALSALATAYVAKGKYQEALEKAEEALELDETNSSALATCAICYGLLDDPLMYKAYSEKAVAQGYKGEKIRNTVEALKKRK